MVDGRVEPKNLIEKIPISHLKIKISGKNINYEFMPPSRKDAKDARSFALRNFAIWRLGGKI